MPKVGFCPDSLEAVTGDDLKDIASEYADEHHQIDEDSDCDFEVYVEDDNGKLHRFNMKTDWDPVYYVDSQEAVNTNNTWKTANAIK